MNTYTLIAYKVNSESYSRGHLMETYSSDFKMFSSTNISDIISDAAALKAIPLGHQETGYDFYLLNNGLTSSYDDMKAFEKSVDEEVIVLLEKAKKSEEEKQELLRLEDIEKAKKSQAEQDTKDLETYNRLHEKFNGQKSNS